MSGWAQGHAVRASYGLFSPERELLGAVTFGRSFAAPMILAARAARERFASIAPCAPQTPRNAASF
jgi:hypothetical protein